MPLANAEELDWNATVMLADSVASGDGKLFIQGAGWDSMNPPMYPCRVARLGIAITLACPYGQTNRNHTLNVRLINQDGVELQIGLQPSDPNDPASVPISMTKIEAVVNVGRPPHLQHGDAQTLPMALNLDGIILPEPNSYAIVVEVDGSEIGRAGFRAYAPGVGQRLPGAPGRH